MNNLIKSLEDNFSLTDEGNLETFLGVNFIQEDDSLEINQLYLIEHMLKALSSNDNAKMHDALANATLHKDEDRKKRILVLELLQHFWNIVVYVSYDLS